MVKELSPEELRRTFDPVALGIETTEHLEPLEGIIGQDRAVSALEFGLEMDGTGYNIFVVGPPGIGKMSAVEPLLERLARRKPTPSEWCYVNNFHDPYEPHCLELPAGWGRALQQDMKGLIEHIRRELPRAFETEEYTASREEITSSVNRQREAISNELNERAAQAGFRMQSSPMGIMLVPVKDDKPLSNEQFRSLPEAEQEELQQRRQELQKELKSAMKQIRQLEREAQERLKELDQQVALHIVGGLIDDLKEKYQGLAEVIEYLRSVQEDIIENIEAFKAEQAQEQQPGTGSPQQAFQAQMQLQLLQELAFRKYQVNVLVDNSNREGAPVVLELNPSYPHLFGRIEKEMQMGALSTDFTMIRPGALHQANGGYLILPAEDVLRNLLSWDSLKRALRGGEIRPEELGERLGFLTTKSLRPESIPINLKVVLVGRPSIYYLLHTFDEDFSELFKVKADFDTRMDYVDQNVQGFLAFLCKYCKEENLKPLDSSGAGKLLEHASRLAEDQEKLSTQFGALADVIREAHHWAGKDRAANVSGAHVQKAIDQKIYRSNMIQQRIQEMIERGTILIDVAGQAVGQVNGLSVITLGDYMFGRPNRITASVRPGREGIIDIEREVKLGGPIHSKGVLILSGYLAEKFAADLPLTLAARVVFEQSYEGVEGDSASSTELYALLSSLSNVPIKQGLAVTGSVNQHGEVQAIGGVNQKIEGFYDICKAKGLTGEQGVIIPGSNVKNLMLREEVVQAVKSGRFHIWSVETIDEGIELLTGMPAGARGEDNRFPEDTVNHKVEQRLGEFAERWKELPQARGRESS